MNSLALNALRSVSPAWKALQARKMDRLAQVHARCRPADQSARGQTRKQLMAAFLQELMAAQALKPDIRDAIPGLSVACAAGDEHEDPAPRRVYLSDFLRDFCWDGFR